MHPSAPTDPGSGWMVLRTPFLSRRRGFERADSEYTDKLQHYTSGHSTYRGPPPGLGVRSLFGLCSCSLIPCGVRGGLRPPNRAGMCLVDRKISVLSPMTSVPALPRRVRAPHTSVLSGATVQHLCCKPL